MIGYDIQPGWREAIFVLLLLVYLGWLLFGRGTYLSETRPMKTVFGRLVAIGLFAGFIAVVVLVYR